MDEVLPPDLPALYVVVESADAGDFVARFIGERVVHHHEAVLRPPGSVVPLQFLKSVEVQLLIIPVIFAQQLVHRPLAFRRHHVWGDAVDGLVGGGDQASDVRFYVAALVMRQAVEPVGRGVHDKNRVKGSMSPQPADETLAT